MDPETNILSEPNKIQIQMVEGDNVFKEAISFLKSIKPLKPLEWDQNLYSSAEEHVNDIGPKGLLLYQSSDGTEPEDTHQKQMRRSMYRADLSRFLHHGIRSAQWPR